MPERHTDHDLTAFAVVLWLASVLRVTLALESREAFATEATLALACVVLLPWMVLRRSIQHQVVDPEVHVSRLENVELDTDDLGRVERNDAAPSSRLGQLGEARRHARPGR